MIPRCPDVVVVGAGVIGLSTAYYLAKAGASVVVLDSRDVAAGTSGACDGSVMLQSKDPGPVLEIAKASAALFPELIEELDPDIEYDRIGSLMLFESEDDIAALEPLARAQRESGLDIQLLSTSEAREIQPGIADSVVLARYLPTDAVVDQLGLCFALSRAARSMGAEVRLGVTATGIATDHDSVAGVHTDRGTVAAATVVIALGVWTPELAETVGVNIDILPRKGHILVTERMPRLLRTVVLSPSYVRRKHDAQATSTSAGGAESVSFALHQSRGGTCFIGSSREFAGFDDSTSHEVIRAIAIEAIRVLPDIAGALVIRSYAGLRPYTADRKPVIGGVPGWRGLFVAAGHEGDGIALGPITGKAISELALRGECSLDLSPFAPSRFGDSHAAAS